MANSLSRVTRPCSLTGVWGLSMIAAWPGAALAQTEPDAAAGAGLLVPLMVALVLALLVLAVALFMNARLSARMTLMEDRSLKQETEISTLRSRISGLNQQLSDTGQSLLRLSSRVEEASAPADTPDTGTDTDPATDIMAETPIATVPTEEEQPDLPLSDVGDEAAGWPDPETLLRALNFPQDADDAAGFSALRRARAAPLMADLLLAAEDVLTILSQDGTYMDDLQVPPPDAALWRAFADGVRGPEIDALGAITAPDVIERTAIRLREDPIFRDAALHFLQRFDRMLTRFAPDVPDAALDALGVTRTARGFMLLARVAGSFD